MKQVKCAFFDMDGTLVDSMAYWRNIINEYLAEGGEAPLSEEEQCAIESMRFVDGINYFKSIRKTPYAQAFTKEMGIRILEGHYRRDVRIIPGIREMLSAYAAQGVRMAVITATPHALAEVCLSLCGIRDFFEVIIGGGDFPTGKGHPDIFLHAMSLFGARPEECVMFEDALYSAETAKSLGMGLVVIEEAFQAHNKERLFSIADEYYAVTDGTLCRLK